MASNPTLLVQPIAENGTKNTIPATTTTPGAMSQDQGFPAETSLPLGAGGVAPTREDFNGAFNLLSDLNFYTQKGWVYQFDAGQAYYAGCIVRDTTDGLLYECINDVAAGGSVPSLDAVNWQVFKSGLDRESIPAFNTRDVITTSGTYTAPVTGWYKITVKGGGGGGAGGFSVYSTNQFYGGASGGEGGTTIGYEYITAGDTVTVTIGAGGTGGTGGSSNSGTAGGNSSVTVNGNTYTAGGGGEGQNAASNQQFSGGDGGTGTIDGHCGNPPKVIYNGSTVGQSGGGAGGGYCVFNASSGELNGVNGGGGAGGQSAVTAWGGDGNGGAGGDGFAWFEYFAAI